jgi:HAD superfamily hydrolase (TIGR01509 family)
MSNAASPIDWSRIDTVLLDMDGTLLDLAFDNYFWLELVPAQFAVANGVPHATAKVHVTQRFDAAAGTLAWYCIEHWSRELALDLRALKHAARERIAFLRGAPEFLQSLRQRGKRTCIVTNAHPHALEVKSAVTAVDRLVDRVISSHEYGAPKESQDFWVRLQRHEPFDPERTLLVEDSLAVLRAARAFGIRHAVAIRCPDSGQPKRTIAEFPAVDGVIDLL